MAQKDKFGRHECLDRAALLMDAVDDWLLQHKGLKKSEHKLAEKAHKALFDLYQEIGANTL